MSSCERSASYRCERPSNDRLAKGVGHTCSVCFVGYFEHRKDNISSAMSRTTTMTVRLGGALSEFVSANVGDDGSYENVSEYICDLIRRDKERAEQEAFSRLKAELTHAFSAPEDSYQSLTAAEVIARNRA